jgi:hypothetical protein
MERLGWERASGNAGRPQRTQRDRSQVTGGAFARPSQNLYLGTVDPSRFTEGWWNRLV